MIFVKLLPTATMCNQPLVDVANEIIHAGLASSKLENMGDATPLVRVTDELKKLTMLEELNIDLRSLAPQDGKQDNTPYWVATGSNLLNEVTRLTQTLSSASSLFGMEDMQAQFVALRGPKSGSYAGDAVGILTRNTQAIVIPHVYVRIYTNPEFLAAVRDDTQELQEWLEYEEEYATARRWEGRD